MFSPVPDQDFQELNKKFRDSREGINKLSEVEQYNKSQKEAVIAEVQALNKDEIDEGS